MFVDAVPIRVDLRDDPRPHTVLERVSAASTVSYRHADLPFDAIAAAVHPDRDLSRPAATRVYLAWADSPTRAPLSGRLVPLDPVKVKYELEFTATEVDGSLRSRCRI
jgi:hypothetical protein